MIFSYFTQIPYLMLRSDHWVRVDRKNQITPVNNVIATTEPIIFNWPTFMVITIIIIK